MQKSKRRLEPSVCPYLREQHPISSALPTLSPIPRKSQQFQAEAAIFNN